MDSPTDNSLPAFINMTQWLLDAGLSAPKILGRDMRNGWLLLEDFGNDLFSTLIETNATKQLYLYEQAIDVLLRIRRRPFPELPSPSASDLVEATYITLTWYPGADKDALHSIQSRLADLLDELLSEEPTVSLRDFHADNMIWLTNRERVRRVGLLDYQDAFLTHHAYDLMSLLTDARTEVPAHVADETLRAYAKKSGDSLESLERAVAILGVQRNLRILGIFFRAAHRDGKPHRLPAVPRVRNHFARCLSHPVFSAVSSQLDRALPEPSNL